MELNLVVALSLIRSVSDHLGEYCGSPESNSMPPAVAWVLSENLKNALSLIPETE